MFLTKEAASQKQLGRCHAFQLLLLLILATQTVLGGNRVKFLPGYEGELPFKLETGYIKVDGSELFYYFIESQGNPKEDPILLWLSGGPGCSSFNGLVYEIGPIEFVIENYTGGLPNLRYYPYTWTETASIIFLDAPIGTGFSYSTIQDGWATSDSKSAEQSYQFIKKWFKENPQYLGVQFFVSGDSYSGITVPLITLKVIKGNENGDKPKLNLRGYLIGSPYTDSVIDVNSKVVFAHRMALISDQMYENAKIACNETYTNVDPANTACVLALGAINKCLNGIDTAAILEPKCTYVTPEPNEHEPLRRSVKEDSFQISPLAIPKMWCHSFNFSLATIWFNDDTVQNALHVRKGMVPSWTRCNWTLSYTKDIPTVVPIHQQLKKMNLVVLIDSGDRDLVVPYPGTVNWVKSLNITEVDSWRPWFIDGQVAGYTVKYSEDAYYLTYATVKGAGHPAPEYYRKQCFYMFDRWIHYYPL